MNIRLDSHTIDFNLVLILTKIYYYFSAGVNFEELARCTDDFNGATCKAVCVEAVRVSEIENLSVIVIVVIFDLVYCYSINIILMF